MTSKLESLEVLSITCMGCKIEKPIGMFWKRKTGRFGRRSRCSKCLGPQWRKQHRQQNAKCFGCGFTELAALRRIYKKGSKVFQCLNCKSIERANQLK
jgi:hypothetical protein